MLLLLVLGCDPDCDDTSRIDGAYAVWSHSVTTGGALDGQNLENYPYDDALFNGWSEWDLKYVPSMQAFQINIDDQPFEAAYSQDPTNCNAFDLVIQGTYAAESSTHTFLWQGSLSYFGVHLGGTFSYEDNWVSNDGESGSITVPLGELNASIRSDDTGA